MEPNPKVLIAYTCVTHGKLTDGYAARFSATYQLFPPGEPHELVVICNGGPLRATTELTFAGTQCTFYPRQNDEGRDITGYMDLAKNLVNCDMLVCLGESVYFHKSGWLKRLVEAWTKHGPGMYGFFATYAVRAHMNTTAFACAPSMLLDYPLVVKDQESRYAWEHGEKAFWRFLASKRIPTMFVTWDGEWHPRQWRSPRNILWRGDQSGLMAFCNHTDRFIEAKPRTRSQWAMMADGPFR